jgi:hypothetical protein
LVERGTPVPQGYTLIGSFSQILDGRPTRKIVIEIYRKDQG